MPRTPIDYSKTVIYGIFPNSGSSDVYIGHTTDFKHRKQGHKQSCNNPSVKNYNLKVYKTIRENGGWDNYTMRLIEEYPCSSHNEAAAREFYYFQIYSATLNCAVPNRTKNEWYYDNQEHCREQGRTRYINNTEQHKELCKKYVSLNSEKIKAYKKEYYESHKTETLKIQKEKTICECGISCNRGSLIKHTKTEKHAKLMESKTV